MLEVITLAVSPLFSNCHLLFDSETRKALIIDPGGDADRIIQTIEQKRLVPQQVINTHGHGDHIAANQRMVEQYQIPLAIHHEDAAMLTDAEANLSALIGMPVTSPPADRLLEQDDQINLAGSVITVRHTPGHSPGGIALCVDGMVFSGDALFAGSIGRSDLPGAAHDVLIHSIFTQLLALPDETRVFPGHGPETTIGQERQSNPFLQTPPS